MHHDRAGARKRRGGWWSAGNRGSGARRADARGAARWRNSTTRHATRRSGRSRGGVFAARSARASRETHRSWLLVGRCRTATSSVLPAGVSFFFACAVTFAAFASLGVAAAESSSLPLEAALVSGAGAPLRGAALPREAGRAVAFSGASVPSMPVSSEWSEECSAAAADAAARRVGLTCSISRSCAIARIVGKGGGESSASRASRARRLRRSQSESRGESAGTKTGGF